MLCILKERGQKLPLMGVGSEDAHPNPYSFIISQTTVLRKISFIKNLSGLILIRGTFRLPGSFSW
jgi:hypothetical protein